MNHSRHVKQAKQQKRAPRRQQKRAMATKRVAPVATSQKRSIATTGPVLSASHPLYQTMHKATSSQINAIPASVMGPQRNIAIRSVQVAWLKNWLCKRGLYFEDIYEARNVCQLALDSLPRDVRTDRMRRIVRSIDMEMKLVNLPDDMQDYDPFVSYGLDDAYSHVALLSAAETNYV